MPGCDAWAPRGVTEAFSSTSFAGAASATAFSVDLMTPGGSPAAKLNVAFALKKGAVVRLRLMKASPASAAFGMIWIPFSVSMCTARQFTSATRPLPNLVSR